MKVVLGSSRWIYFLRADRYAADLAADLSLRHGLAMADTIVYVTAQDQEAEVVTGEYRPEESVGSGLRQVGVQDNSPI